jgi:hypothetical protein
LESHNIHARDPEVKQKQSLDLPPLAERRPKPRARVVVGAIIVWDDGRSKLNCRIRDINDGGARVAISGAKYLPATLYLINVRDHICHGARIAWRGADEIGVGFTNSFDLLRVTNPGLIYLRKIWDERANANALWKA